MEQDLSSKTLSNPIALLPYGKQNTLLALHANKSQTQAEPPDSSWVLSTQRALHNLRPSFSSDLLLCPSGDVLLELKQYLKCPRGVQDSAGVTSASTFTGLVLH